MKQKIIELRLSGKTYNEISSILGCSKSLINYYCKKLESNQELREISIKTKNDKQKIVIDSSIVDMVKSLMDQSKSYRYISNQVGLSVFIIKSICRKYEFRRVGISIDDRNYIISLFDGGNSISEIYRITGISRNTISTLLNEKGLIYTSNKSLEEKNGNIKAWRRKMKRELIEYKGGMCSICGYNRCQRALQFHHTDPRKKDFNISGNYFSFEVVKEEVDKCVLLCSNCHAEVHEKLISLGNIS